MARGGDLGQEDYGGYDDASGHDGYNDSPGGDVVIDEEELALLREMKDLKRSYRDYFEKLK